MAFDLDDEELEATRKLYGFDKKRNYIITKQQFVEIIEDLREANDFVEETNERARQLKDAIMSDFYNTMSLSISHEHLVVLLLEKMFNDKDILSWWLYELDYGRNFKMGNLQETKNVIIIDIDLSSPEKLYDYLVSERDRNE